MNPSPSSPKKDIVVILNGISLRKKNFYHHLLPALTKVANVEVFETLSKNDGVSLASKATLQSPDLILAAGGDGTLNQVVNGVLTGRETERNLPVIGLIPMGSGNDFARTAGLTADVKQLLSLVTRFEPKPIDVGKVNFTAFHSTDTKNRNERYFINVADLGMGPVVVDKVLRSGRPFGHGLAYYKSILSTFVSYKSMQVKATSQDWSWEGKLRTLAVGNGKCYGHGLHIAPDALLDDRLFHVFICGRVSAFDFIRFTGTLKKGGHIRIPEVHYKVATSVELASESFCMIEGDGEIFGTLPASVSLIERRLDFLI
jgi:YegS/Rv2252/BmrU family lipid kinase